MLTFLGMEAERDMDTPCTEASMTLSASQSIQSTPAFYRGSDLRPRLNIPESVAMARSPHMRPMERGGMAPLIRLDESPLAAMSQREPIKSFKRLRRHRSKASLSPGDGQAIGARAVKSIKDLKTLTTDSRGIQTATGEPQEKPVAPKRPACSRCLPQRVIKTDIKQSMREPRKGVPKSGIQRLQEACHPPSQGRAERRQTSNPLRKTPDKCNEVKQPVYTPTTITTGCSRRTSPSGYHQEALADYRPPRTMARLDESKYRAPAARLLRHSSGNVPTNPITRPEQSPTSPAGDKSAGERQVGTTYLEEAHKTQSAEELWRNRRLIRLAMLAQDDSSLHRSTFTQGPTFLATTPCKRSFTTSQDLVELVTEGELILAGDPFQMQGRPGEHWYPENQDEDDTEDPLQRNWNLDDTDALGTQPGDEDKARSGEQDKTAGSKRLLECLKAWGRLYWSTVWPILDPRTLRVEHDGPLPFWKACLLIALAVPAAAVGYVVAVQAVRLVCLLVWLMSYVDDGLAVWA
ncbi:hypothetical protein V8C26DRAFT_392309 [Trichoderma gracile]